MRTKLNRIKHLKILVGLHGYNEVAEKAGTSYDNIWQIVNGTLLPSGKPRGVGDDLTRRIEAAYAEDAKGKKRDPGWMDNDPTWSPRAVKIVDMYSRLSPAEQERLGPVIEAVIGPHVSDEEVEERMPITAPEKQKRQ